MKYTFNPILLCAANDRKAHYFTSLAERNGYKVVEINNRSYILQVTEYVYRSQDAVFEEVESGTYIFKE